LRSFEDRSLERRPPVVLDAVDPAQPYGASLPWPKRPLATSTDNTAVRGPQRVAGADVVLVGGEPVVYLERSLKGILTLVSADDERLPAALRVLCEHARTARKRLQIERIDGEPAAGHRLSGALQEAGLVAGPKRFTLGPS